MTKNPRAFSFNLYDCGDPKCGVHVVSFNNNGEVILETVMSPAQTLYMIKFGQDLLYRKIVENEQY